MFHEQILSRNDPRFMKIRKQMITEKKNNNFTININYLLYISKSICFSHTFVYHRSILYQMLLRFFKVENAVMEMIMFFGFPFRFRFFSSTLDCWKLELASFFCCYASTARFGIFSIVGRFIFFEIFCAVEFFNASLSSTYP